MGAEGPLPSSVASQSPPLTEAPVKSPTRRRWPLVAGLVVLVAAAGLFGYWYIWGLTHESTDDAQVEGHIHQIASQVAGYVREVRVEDNELVEKGQVLVQIRPEDYQAQVDLAQARLAEAQAQQSVAERNLGVLKQTTQAGIEQARATMQRQQAQLEVSRRDAETAAARFTAAKAAADQAESQVKAAQAEFDYANWNLKRISEIYARGEAAEDEMHSARSSYDATQARLAAAKEQVSQAHATADAAEKTAKSAEAAVNVAQAAVAEAQGNLDEQLAGPERVRAAEAQAELARAGVQSAQAQLDQARLNLGYTNITAPTRGVVSKRSVESGNYLQPGQPVLAVVPLHDTWVLANFKETQLRDMRPGQPAELHVDAYPDHPFRGVIDSISAGTGARFSLLPPENATGNYVKVVQRLPVKIVLAAGERDPDRPLRPGMNVVVTVDTGAKMAAEQAAAAKQFRLAATPPAAVQPAQGAPQASAGPSEAVAQAPDASLEAVGQVSEPPAPASANVAPSSP
jgi:membrane fusion protein (multidrug efflux system)